MFSSFLCGLKISAVSNSLILGVGELCLDCLPNFTTDSEGTYGNRSQVCKGNNMS